MPQCQKQQTLKSSNRLQGYIWGPLWGIFWILGLTNHWGIAGYYMLILVFVLSPIFYGWNKIRSRTRFASSIANPERNQQQPAHPLTTYREIYHPYQQGYPPVAEVHPEPTQPKNFSSLEEYEQPQAQYPEQLPPMEQ